MGIFGKLFEKKSCSICGGEIGLLGNRKLEDGNMCKNCASQLSPWFSDRRSSTVAQIKEQLDYGGAYLDIYDGTTLDSIARYEGTWACKDAQCLELDLTCTENDDGSNFYDQAIKGTYLYSRSDDAEMTLTLAVKDEKTTPLYTGHRDEPITFRLTNPDDFVETEERMCSVALNYHEAVYGYLPGYACSEGYEDGYYLIHLYDDMGDHTATAAWYMINPDSLKGYDYMTGDAIDFADYLEAKAVG